MLSLYFPIKPEPKLRARKGKFGNWYTPDKTKNFEYQITMYAKQRLPKGFKPYSKVPLTVVIEYGMAQPKSSKKDGYHIIKPDLDNLIKSVTDALNGLVWEDDCIIASLRATKIYVDTPFIHLIVNEND